MYDKAIEAGGVAVVTGAASGVGRVAALRFAQAGFSVMLADLPGEALTTRWPRLSGTRKRALQLRRCLRMSRRT